MNKKMKEERLLRKIYKRENIEKEIQSEEPDFILVHASGGHRFGVEITEFYSSETAARLKNIPNYPLDLMNDKSFRHKNDRKALNVDNIDVYSKENEHQFTTKAVIEELPKADEYLSKLVRLIQEKNSKFTHYNKNLHHINLIVSEISTIFSEFPKDKFYFRYFTSELSKAVASSPFREIYLITTVKEAKEVYIPLKALLLLAEVYIFGEILHLSKPNYDEPEEKFMNQLAQHLLRRGFESVYLKHFEDILELVHSRYGIVFTEESTKVHDYVDFKVTGDLKSIEKVIDPLFKCEKFLEKEKEVLDSYTFTSEIAYEVNL